MRVSDLSGALLDEWVARANGFSEKNFSRYKAPHDREERFFIHLTPYSPSTRWEQGGPIIARERGAIAPAFPDEEPVIYWAFMGVGPVRWQSSGPTHLIAAMRAFVKSKFGDEVDADSLRALMEKA